jgi:hypothetical protein
MALAIARQAAALPWRAPRFHAAPSALHLERIHKLVLWLGKARNCADFCARFAFMDMLLGEQTKKFIRGAKLVSLERVHKLIWLGKSPLFPHSQTFKLFAKASRAKSAFAKFAFKDCS